MTSTSTSVKADSTVAFTAKGSLFTMVLSFASKVGEISIWAHWAGASDNSPGMFSGFMENSGVAEQFGVGGDFVRFLVGWGFLETSGGS